MQFHFDSNGNLTPYSKITTDLATFEKVFVTDFENSTTRKTLFDNYLRYLEAFSKEITPNFTQWINGSFVTLKENPKDIDFVTFIPFEVYEKNKLLIEKSFWSYALEKEGLDAYIVQIYPENHKLFLSDTVKFREDWISRFTKTKLSENLIYFPKGFIEVIY